MKTFRAFMVEASQFEKLLSLGFGQAADISSQVAGAYARHFKVALPKSIGETVLLHPAGPSIGSKTLTKIVNGRYRMVHNNDPTNPEAARRDIPYGQS